MINYAYDVRGNKIYEGGATYPVAYEYDTFGRKVKMTTYREETEDAEGDVTTWMIQYSDGAKIFQIDTSLHFIEEFLFEKITEAEDIYLDGERLE